MQYLLLSILVISLAGIFTIPSAFAENWYYYVEPPPSWASHASGAIDSAVKTWEDANPGLNFIKVSSWEQADFTVDWVKEFADEKVGYAMGSWYMEIGLGDSNCDGKTWRPYSENYIETIATHEVGHILGLEHSNNPNDIMYPTALNFEYALLEYEVNLAPGYGYWVPACTSQEITTYSWSVTSDDPTYGFNVYFLDSYEEFQNWQNTGNFLHYIGDGCYAQNMLSVSRICSGVSGESGLLVIMPNSSQSLTTINIKLMENAGSSNAIPDNPGSTSTPTPTPAPAPTPTPTPTPAPTSAKEVIIQNAPGSSVPGCQPNCFIPGTVTINTGDTIVWTNPDSDKHIVASGTTAGGPDGIFNSAFIMVGGSFSHKFNTSGTYDYFCIVHPWMEGKVIVQTSSSPTPEPAPAPTPTPTPTPPPESTPTPTPTSISVSENQWGTISVEKTVLELPYTARDNTQFEKIKIFGQVPDPGKSAWIHMTVTEPDGKTSKVKVSVKKSGNYENYILICCNEIGKYTVSTKYNGNNLGTVTFDVVESGSSFTPQPTTIISSVTTDQSSYSEGDTIKISGSIINYDSSNVNHVTITIKNPTGITAYFDQIQPTSDGQFSQAISTVNQLDESGQYTVIVDFGEQQKTSNFVFVAHFESAQPDYFSTYEDKTAGFSIGYPDDWILVEGHPTALVSFNDQDDWTTNVQVFFYEGDTEKGSFGESRTNNQILEQIQYNWSEYCEDSTFAVDDRICSNFKVIDSMVLYTNDNRKVYYNEVSYTLEFDDPSYPDQYPMIATSGLIYGSNGSWEVGSESDDVAFANHSDESMNMIKSFSLVATPTPTPSSEGFEWIAILVVLGAGFAGVAVFIVNKNKKKIPATQVVQRPKTTQVVQRSKTTQVTQQSKIICPICKQPNRPTSKICGKCGNPIEGKEKPKIICPICKQPNRPTSKICGKCGNPIK